MSCVIRVNNKVGVKGDISGVAESYPNMTENESLSAWVSVHGTSNLSEYHRNFSYITVTDKTFEELAHLTDALIIDVDPIGGKWYFVEPPSDNIDWKELFQTGEVARNWAEVLPYLRERN